MNKAMTNKIGLLILLSGLGISFGEIQAVKKAGVLQKDPIWQMVLATKKFATPYIKDLTTKFPQLKSPSAPYALSTLGISALLGLYAARKPLNKKLKQSFEYVQYRYNKLPMPLQWVIAAPFAVFGGTLAAHYSAVAAPDKTTSSLLEKTVFTGAASVIFNKMTNGSLHKLFTTNQNPADDVVSKPASKFYDPALENEENISSYQELVASCSETELRYFLADLANGECKNLLLYGQSNTGKTTFAKDICAALKRQALITQSTELNSEIYVGSGEKKFKDLIVAMKQLPESAIVVLDEADIFLAENADGLQKNHQLSMNKMIMEILNTAHANKLCVIMITNIRNPKEIPPTIVNRFTRVTEKSEGGYIVEKGLPNLLGRESICERAVREAIKNKKNQKYIFPDLGSFGLYIAKYTAGCNNAEIVNIVNRIFKFHEEYASNGNTAIISVKIPYSVRLINQALRENNFDGLDQMIDFLASSEQTAQDKKEKERIKKEKEKYEKELEESTKLRSDLILNDYKLTLQETFSSPNNVDQDLQLIASYLEKALYPHQQRIEGLKADRTAKEKDITKAFDDLKTSKDELIKIIDSKFLTENKNNKKNKNTQKWYTKDAWPLVQALNQYIKDPTKTNQENLQKLKISTLAASNKLNEPEQLKLKHAYNDFIIKSSISSEALKVPQTITSLIEGLEKQHKQLQENNKAATNALDLIKKNSIEELKNLFAPEHNAEDGGTIYIKLQTIYSEVVSEYEKYKYHLPLLSRDDLLKVAQEVQKALDYTTHNDFDIEAQNRDYIILNKLGVNIDKTLFASTVKSLTIATLKTTWNCIKYPFTSAKKRRTLSTRISDKSKRNNIQFDEFKLVEQLSKNPVESKHTLQELIVSSFLENCKNKYKEQKTEKEIITNILKTDAKDLHIRKGRDKILEVSTDGKNFISLFDIAAEFHNKDLKKYYEVDDALNEC